MLNAKFAFSEMVCWILSQVFGFLHLLPFILAVPAFLSGEILNLVCSAITEQTQFHISASQSLPLLLSLQTVVLSLNMKYETKSAQS